MATFPAIVPSSREYAPGEYPNSPFRAMSGVESRVRHSSVQTASQVRLRFVDLTEAEMLEILAHYNGQAGGWQPFALPATSWSGTDNANDYLLPGYAWRYLEPPTVSDYSCGGHDVEVLLETVAGEGVGLLGIDATIGILLSAGKAAASNGVSLTIAASLTTGIEVAPGASFTVTASLSAGTAVESIAASAPPFYGYIGIGLNPGPAIGNLGKLFQVVSSLAVSKTYSSADSDFGSVQLLLHGDGANGSTTFIDSSLREYALTAFGNAAISTSKFRFGGASMYFDGSGDYVSVQSPTYDLLDWWVGGYTLECWIYMLAAPANTANQYVSSPLMGNASTSDLGEYWSFGPLNNQKLRFYYWNGTPNTFTTTATAALNTWVHIAMVHDNGSIRLYIDGVKDHDSQYTGNTPLTTTSYPFLVGRVTNVGGFNGYVDELRVSRIARYSGNFTPSRSSFPDQTSVQYAAPFGIESTVTASLSAGAASSS